MSCVPFFGPFKLGQRFDDVIEAQPQTPAVMIKGDGKDNGHDEQKHQDTFVFEPDQKQGETDHKDNQFGGDYVGKNRADEEAVLALKKRKTVGAMVSDPKRLCGDSYFATGGTTQFQTAPQYPFDLLIIRFQNVGTFYRADHETKSGQTDSDSERDKVD